ncbi:MAG: M13 family metallopeptidase [Eubacteriales bacterium]|nr:M13 family metallopeptidase [Eubacteriales bacterium]
MSVGTTFTNHDVNTVIIDVTDQYTLDSANSYTDISDAGKLKMQVSNTSVRLLLSKLGYSDAKINGIIRDCYRFETRLAKASQLVSSATDVESYLAETDNRCSFSELQALQGDFPLTEILAHYGYDIAESYSLTYPKFLASVGILYNARYLDEIKAYYMVHTLQDCMPLVDRDTFDRLQEMTNEISENTKESETEAPDPYAETKGELSGEDKETAILLDNFIGKYLSEPLDQVYIARHCTAEQKAALKDLIARIVTYYSEMLYAEDWLSEAAREKAVDKLSNMTVRAVYPDTFTDYSGLTINASETLVDAVAAINAFHMTQRVEKINTKKERNEWDMKALSTTQPNAMYQPSDNSINILTGIMADGFMFNVDDRYEETLAKIGMIVGHEITHGFDTSGYRFDKDGYYQSWWTPDDLQAFQLRASKLSNYYSGIIPYPGATGYSGDIVKGEAIADMGGVKCMLGIAEGVPGFDYELFFKTYAMMWRMKDTYAIESALSSDEHPLNFLRVNATLQQFEKFYETYDIKPGDGMYLAPDNRVAVW